MPDNNPIPFIDIAFPPLINLPAQEPFEDMFLVEGQPMIVPAGARVRISNPNGV